MTLMRGFSWVKKDGTAAGGTLAIPKNIQRQAHFRPGSPLVFLVIRLKGCGRPPHFVFHGPDRAPFLSPDDAIMLRGLTVLDEDGAIALPDAVLEEARLEVVDLVELKVSGPIENQWLVAYNRGPRFSRCRPGKSRITTRKRMKGKTTDEKTTKEWKKISLDY